MRNNPYVFRRFARLATATWFIFLAMVVVGRFAEARWLGYAALPFLAGTFALLIAGVVVSRRP